MEYTTREQSLVLENEGLEITTADMFYNEEPDEYTNIEVDKYPQLILEGQSNYLEYYGVPCWTADRLLKLIPKRVGDMTLEMGFDTLGDGSDEYSIFYVDGSDSPLFGFNSGKSLFECALKMVVWCLKNQYIKNTKHEKPDLSKLTKGKVLIS